MLGEIHNNKQESEWLDSLVADPEFADHVDDIVMELGNSLYQKSVDRYTAGEAVSIEEVQRPWRNVIGMGPPPPIYGNLHKSVRETNMRRRGTHQIRVLCGDPYFIGHMAVGWLLIPVAAAPLETVLFLWPPSIKTNGNQIAT